MPRTTIFDKLFHSTASRQNFIYWQTVSLRRLTFLLLVVFCLFGMVGFIVDLFALGQKPLITVVFWTVFTGLMGVNYILVLTRRPHYIPAAVFLQLVGS
jgi:hypothetical protein